MIKLSLRAKKRLNQCNKSWFQEVQSKYTHSQGTVQGPQLKIAIYQQCGKSASKFKKMLLTVYLNFFILDLVSILSSFSQSAEVRHL